MNQRTVFVVSEHDGSAVLAVFTKREDALKYGIGKVTQVRIWGRLSDIDRNASRNKRAHGFESDLRKE